jgi:hypothetical protein
MHWTNVQYQRILLEQNGGGSSDMPDITRRDIANISAGAAIAGSARACWSRSW